ncbi:MAG TPA: hypothetical protein PLB86_07310 [Dermatophilaceae bacterium]|nr:hypothetical protein [Dermatophilaceae bacterium]
MTDDVAEGSGWPARLDPQRNWIVSAFGRKGSGKTTFNRELYRDYPYAKLCIDVNGEADPGPDAKRIREIDQKMPGPDRDGKPANLHWVADPGSSTYAVDLDRAIGMAMYPSAVQVLVWAGEVGEFTTGNRTGPHLRRLLMQSRHYRTSALFDGPRPIDIDKLVIAQSDIVAVFDLPDPDDRVRVAKVIGYPPARFAIECDETFRRGDYWFLLWVTATKRLYRCPPLPI